MLLRVIPAERRDRRDLGPHDSSETRHDEIPARIRSVHLAGVTVSTDQSSQ